MKKFTVLIFPLLCTLGSAGREKIMIDVKKESWISDEDFRAIIEFSLPQSSCTNTHRNDPSIGADLLFGQFIKNYRFPTVLYRKYDCLGYFGVGGDIEALMNAIREKVPTLISSVELLLVIDNEVPENSPLLNATDFQNANVNIVSKSGMWTLSENYLYPRSFKKISSPGELKHKTGLANLQGRNLQILTSYYIPFCYLSTTKNQTVNGIEAEIFVAKDSQELDGIEIKLFLLMAEKLNFTWTIQKPMGNPYGASINGTRRGGWTEKMIRKDVDMVFRTIWLDERTSLMVNLSRPWEKLAFHFIVPRPKPKTSFWALHKPLSKEVWLALVVMIFIQNFNIYTQARIYPNIPKRFRSSIITFTELLGRLLGSYAPRETKALRTQIYLWHIFGILLVVAYCSSLASKLTTPNYEARIDTLEQFINANLTWGSIFIPHFVGLLDLNDQYGKQIPDKFQIEKTREERGAKMVNGNYAILGKLLNHMFLPIEDIDSIHLEMVDRLGENGLISYHVNDVLYRRTSQGLRSILIDYDGSNDSPKVLELKPLFAGFAFLMFGLLISTIVFCLELRSKRHEKLIIGNSQHPSSKPTQGEMYLRDWNFHLIPPSNTTN